jgi:N-acyl homoserine lactone hydrolase
VQHLSTVSPLRWLMYDTGLGDNHAGRQDEIVDMPLAMTRRLFPQLAQIGLKRSDVKLVALSHFHFDHVRNLAALPRATLLLQRAEAAEMAAHPYPFTPTDAAARLRREPIRLLDGDHDVFGDGSVVLLATPGHSPGHQSLLVRLAHTGPVVLTGDLYLYAAKRRLGRIPEAEKASGTPASRARIEAIVAHERAQLWIEHYFALVRATRKLPRFYD